MWAACCSWTWWWAGWWLAGGWCSPGGWCRMTFSSWWTFTSCRTFLSWGIFLSLRTFLSLWTFPFAEGHVAPPGLPVGEPVAGGAQVLELEPAVGVAEARVVVASAAAGRPEAHSNCDRSAECADHSRALRRHCI